MPFSVPIPATNQVTTVPAPIGGLNARDSLAAMEETDAILMQNWWPQPYGCSVRNGYRKWVTGLPSTAHSLASWASVDGSQKLFAWADTKMYDVTTTGVVGAAIVTGLTNDKWQSVQMNNAAGTTLIAVNGIDEPISYDSGGVGRYNALEWLGVNPSSIVQVAIHQHRLWAVQVDTSFGWFLPPDAVAGTFLKYDFGPLFSRGGFLSYLATWTLDDGNGAEDHLVAVSSQGEAVVYAGTDPTDDTKWGLVGVYYVGQPVAGRIGYSKVGGDLYLLTQQGVVSMTAQLQSTKVNEAQDKLVTNKIQFLISQLISTYSGLDGWALEFYPRYNILLINVPSSSPGATIQVASNTIINSWTQFTSIDAAAWGTLGGSPMFSDYDGNIQIAWDGHLDGVEVDGTGGVGILTAVQQAYSYLQSGATQKQVSMYRPTFMVDSGCSLSTQIVYDFLTVYQLAPGSILPDGTSLWDAALWSGGLWAGGSKVQKSWIQAEGMGVAASLRMSTQSNAETLWVSTDYSYVSGVGLF